MHTGTHSKVQSLQHSEYSSHSLVKLLYMMHNHYHANTLTLIHLENELAFHHFHFISISSPAA